MAEGSDEKVEVVDINVFSIEFDQRCMERHQAGARDYGAVGFLERDVPEMLLEELLDAANYIRYLYIKLRLVQKALEGPEVGPESFNSLHAVKEGPQV